MIKALCLLPVSLLCHGLYFYRIGTTPVGKFGKNYIVTSVVLKNNTFLILNQTELFVNYIQTPLNVNFPHLAGPKYTYTYMCYTTTDHAI